MSFNHLFLPFSKSCLKMKFKTTSLPMKLFKILGSAGKWIAFLMVGAIFVLVFSIYWQVTKGDSADYQSLKDAMIQYGNDMNEIREYLFLPQHEYNFFADENAVPEEGNQDEAEKDTSYLTGVMKFTEALAEENDLAKKRGEAKKLLDDLMIEPRFDSELKNLDLVADKKLQTDEQYTRLKILAGTKPLAQLTVHHHTSEFNMMSILGTEKITLDSEDTLRGEVIDYLTKNKDQILKMQMRTVDQKNQLITFWQDVELQDLLKANTINLKSEAVETEAGFEYSFTDLDGSPLLILVLSRKTGDFLIKEKPYADIATLKPALMTALKSLNGQTENVKMIQEKRTELEAYLKSEEFNKIMKEKALSVAPAREEGTRIYHDLVFGGFENEQKLGSIIFDQLTGEILFMKEADKVEVNLDEILSGSKKKF